MVKPRRHFAQHWLRSEKALSDIVSAAKLDSSDCVLEVGPGMGVLTRRLLPIVQTLLAVEIDRDLCRVLTKEFGKRSNFLLLNADFLSVDLQGLLTGFPAFQRQNKVVANIPYNITGPIIERLLGTISKPNNNPYDLMVLLVQKEVAERLVAVPGTKAFGALSVKVQYLASCEMISVVKAGEFYPPPKVDSAIIRIIPRQIKDVAESPKFLETLVKLGFSSKRKMLKNNLQSVIESDRLNSLLEQLDINPLSRAENLSVEQWVSLANYLYNSGVGVVDSRLEYFAEEEEEED
ncbi:MAG: 16S rRNA (adenine(1518)-N(6)/adenine(1519)-N(6))-dimethyltransferase RsmA [Scytonematopsis contorta HA4267-MV1]|nr:16S rRNA (adenine(1518)-N(6)/adenine(1519)-N(6))-dimethyltransferase RsmA [Scytonematopsis contorta HA4267-MV1]